MADTKLTDDQVADLPAILRSDKVLDAKVTYVNAIKSGIKQHNVPEHLIPSLFDGLRTVASSQHAALMNAGFTALNHLLTRMSRQDPKMLGKEAAKTLPLLVEKMGDQKDKFRTLASQSLTTMYGVAPLDTERVLRNQAMGGKNARAKEASLQWLLEMHRDHGLPFRGYVPLLMDLLEDADGMVRDATKHTVIELFRNAPNAAKSDLKRQLKNFKVRPAIEQAIVKELVPTSARSDESAEPASATVSAKAPSLSASVSAHSVARPVTPGPPVDTGAEKINPQYVNTNRELDDIIKGMAWFFEGRESEQNWLKREESIQVLRRLTAGNAAEEFHDTFVNGLRSLLDGIIKAITSLRTSLSKEGCGLVQEMATVLGPSMDPMVELLMQCLIKLCGGTKKIASQLAFQTVDIIISRVTYNSRIMQHVWGACQDKNVQPRTYAPTWLLTILNKEAHHKSHIEHGGGVDTFEKCIKKGLADANPGVREKMRGTYWAFAGVWPARAEAIMANLDATAAKLLNKDPNNPNSPKKADPPRPGLGMSRSTMSTKPSLRETMLAQKKAAMSAKHNLPARPGSAMAQLSPVRPTASTSHHHAPEKHTSSASNFSASTGPGGGRSTVRSRPDGTISVKAGGMSVAPMRPARRRPEVARPATAGPYSVRDAPSTMDAPSPESIRQKAKTPLKQKDTTPRRTAAPRPRPGHASHASESSVTVSPSTARAAAAGSRIAAASPKISPSKFRHSHTMPSLASPPRMPIMPVEEPEAVLAPAADLVSENEEVEMPDIAALQVSEPVQEPVSEAMDVDEQILDEAANEPAVRESEPENADIADTPTQDETTTEEPVEEDIPEAPASPSPAPAVQTLASPIKLSRHADEGAPAKTLEVYEDPETETQASPLKPTPTPRVLEEKPVNEDAANLQRSPNGDFQSSDATQDTEKSRQNVRLLDSGISKIQAKSLEVHGFRKLQSLLRDPRTIFTDDRFEGLLLGLFSYLEDPLSETPAEKVQDVKAQILATIKLLLKTQRQNFQPHVSKGLESLLQTRSAYDSRSHIVSGLELLASELVSLGDAPEIVIVLTRRLSSSTDTNIPDCRSLTMGLHVLRDLIDQRTDFMPSDTELAQLAGLAGGKLDSKDSGVRMGAVQLCVALHGRVGESVFWESVRGVKDDPKSLITYYVVKRQRETEGAATGAV